MGATGMLKLPGRVVDDRKKLPVAVATPLQLFGQLTGILQRPFPYGHDKTVLLGERDQLRRLQEAFLGVLPPHKRLHAPRLAGTEVHDRLVMDLELVVLQGTPQVILYVQARQRSLVLTPVEELVL